MSPILDRAYRCLQTGSLTILTQEPVFTGHWLRRMVWQWYSSARQRLLEEADRVRGPLVVRQNLLTGLSQIGRPFRFNPPTFAVSPYVGVLSNIHALQWAIQAKRCGRIQRLVAGPNLVVTPLEADGVLCAPEIDVVVTPCRWVSEWYVSLAPQLKGKVMEWPVGVDTDFWCPDTTIHSDKPRQWLIYDKTSKGGKAELKAVQSELDRREELYEAIVYGQYTREHYRSILRRSKAVIVLSPSESQGIAQLEAWACDVPVLVWDRHRIEWKDLVFDGPSASSSPYLSPECGMRFSNQQDLANILDQFIQNLDHFSPREYVLRHFTLSKAALSYVNIFRR